MINFQRLARGLGTLIGIFLGGCVGLIAGIAFSFWCYHQSRAGDEGGGYEIEVVIFILGCIGCIGILGAAVGAVVGGIVGFLMSRADSSSKSRSAPEEFF